MYLHVNYTAFLGEKEEKKRQIYFKGSVWDVGKREEI